MSQTAPDNPRPGGKRSSLRIANLVAAIRFLFPFGSKDERVDSRRSDLDIVSFIVPIGFIIGLLWVVTFRFTWWLYGEFATLRVIPSLFVILLECLISGPFLALGLARTIHILTADRPHIPQSDRLMPLSPVGTLVLCLTILTEFSLILTIQKGEGWWPAVDDWRSHFNFMYPRPLFRPLLLAPIWGRWGILLAASIGKTARNADAETTSLNQGMSPGRLLKHAIIPFCLTAIYCSRSRNYLTGVLIGMLVFGATYLIAVAMARRGGGQSRQSLYAAGQIAQLAFLAIYRACWRLIDA
ncbi:MAG: hypothetical protein IPK83_12310 [Planctomycetes bacterium]|nr:hypothetical protein [Planctomycetota bacterium]